MVNRIRLPDGLSCRVDGFTSKLLGSQSPTKDITTEVIYEDYNMSWDELRHLAEDKVFFAYTTSGTRLITPEKWSAMYEALLNRSSQQGHVRPYTRGDRVL